jgi:hypothetical protein
MSDNYQRIELITGAVRRRHWTTEQKLQIIEESFQPGETVSSVARRRGVAPNLLYRWRPRQAQAPTLLVWECGRCHWRNGGRELSPMPTSFAAYDGHTRAELRGVAQLINRVLTIQ